MPAISIEQLYYAYPPLHPGGDPIRVLKGLDLTVERGEFLALMGRTGAGKSTLCMAINGIVPQSTGGVIHGQVQVLGHAARHTPVGELARHVGIVYQDPESQLFSPTVEEEVAFGPENLGVDPKEIAERVQWALDLMGVASLRRRAPAQLSGGQKQRVAIAAALAMLPEVLILDEPTSNLDPVGQQEVFAAIERLRCERSMTFFMVSHDAERIASYAHRVALLVDGRIARAAEPTVIFGDQGLLQAAGVASPQVAELAVALNRQFHTSYHFTVLDQAERALRQDLARGSSSS